MMAWKNTGLGLLAAAALILLPEAGLRAEVLPDGAGIVYGQGFGFNVKAPKGWTLDTTSGVQQRLHAVFYPNGGSWSGSPVVAYAQSRPKTPEIRTPADAANDTIKRFREQGNSPNYKGSLLKTIKTDAGQEAAIYQFSGDQFGNSEVAAYLMEKDRINFFVMNSADKKLFDQSLPAFEALVKSYLPMTVSVAPSAPAPKNPPAP
jgi:hypothetical protein